MLAIETCTDLATNVSCGSPSGGLGERQLLVEEVIPRDRGRVRTLHGRERVADTIIATSTRPDGTVISPMRLTEAQLTKAVLAARDGSPVTALELAGAALNHERRSQPSLLLVASEVAHELEYRSPVDGAEFRNHLRAVSARDSPPS